MKTARTAGWASCPPHPYHWTMMAYRFWRTILPIIASSRVYMEMVGMKPTLQKLQQAGI